MALIEEAHKAARLLLDHAYVRVLAREDPDAICAAALLGHALRRENVDFHVSWLPRLDDATAAALAEEGNDATVLIGLSQDGVQGWSGGGRQVALETGRSGLPSEARLDASHAVEANPALSLSGLAHLLGVAMGKRNRDLAPLALAGALAAHRHVGGLRGLDAEIREEALESGVLLGEPGIALHGGTLLAALGSLDAPFVGGVTGRARNVKKFLADLKLNADAPPSAVTGDDAERLGSFLALRLLGQGAPDAALDALFRPHHRALQGPHTGMDAGELARLVESACIAGHCGLGFAALWPEPAAGAELMDAAARVREEMVAALLRAERDLRAEGALRVVDAPKACLAGPIADRVALSFAPQGTVALARHVAPEGATFGLRAFGHPADLGKAAHAAALAAGGHAWGEPGRARAWAPAADEGRFLKALAEALP
jgi:hypothetical protein